MSSITFKALPAHVHRALKARAAMHKRSLNQEVLAILEQAVKPARRVDVEGMLAEERRFRESLDLVLTPEEIEMGKREGRP